MNAIIGTDAWRTARQRFVGGSEVAALFGLSPHTTRFQLWHQKAGNLPETDLSDDDRVFWGAILEPAIAAGIARKTGWDVFKAERHVPHRRVDGMAASPDFYAVRGDKAGKGAIEIKTVDWLAFKRWADGEPPMAYVLQLQHTLACAGLMWGTLAVLIGGNDLRLFDYDAHPGTIARIEAEVAAFWQSIRDGKEPQIDFAADAETIRALHVTVGEETRDMTDSNRLPTLCGEYKAAGEDEKAAKERKDAALAEILTLIDSAGVVTTKGYRIKSTIIPAAEIAFTRKASRRTTITEIKQKEA